MLFNSYTFILAFLPVTLAGFLLLRRIGDGGLGLVWLLAASLVFHGWWDVRHTALLAASIAANFLIGGWLATARPGPAKSLALTGGLVLNLGVLALFKYSGLLAETANRIADAGLPVPQWALPLGISFFTFQQIAFLVDAARGLARTEGFVRYATFVTFFPQLVAGPIVHHKELMPQFSGRLQRSPVLRNLAIGCTWFAIGLAKKLLIADGLGEVADPVFAHANSGGTLTVVAAWAAALAYMGQIYFDFSGYSDMAIGIARMFGITLPANFLSPYKARSVIDFWRRWHITLSRFLRDYLYIPLGGNRRGPARRHVNLMLTMVIGGLWHGASWTFALWGGLHGLYLLINHAWRSFAARNAVAASVGRGRGFATAARILTLLAVLLAWVPFRADSLDGTLAMYGAMAGDAPTMTSGLASGLGGVWPVLEAAGATSADVGLKRTRDEDFILIVVAAIIALALPNTWEIFHGPRHRRRADGAIRRFRLRWRPTPAWAAATAALIMGSAFALSRPAPFLYWQF